MMSLIPVQWVDSCDATRMHLLFLRHPDAQSSVWATPPPDACEWIFRRNDPRQVSLDGASVGTRRVLQELPRRGSPREVQDRSSPDDVPGGFQLILIKQKWYWLSAKTPRSDVWLVHEPIDGDVDRLRVLPRFSTVARCSRCGKFDEDELIQVGFDPERKLDVKQEFFGTPNDLALCIVAERVRDVVRGSGISGVRFVPCGQCSMHGALFVMLPEHRSKCITLASQWPRKQYFDPHPAEDEVCNNCGRSITTVGYPRLKDLIFPEHDLIISVPDVRTESRHGVTHHFFCSQHAYEIIRPHKITGICFSNMKSMEDW
jgi:hypothetical protein